MANLSDPVEAPETAASLTANADLIGLRRTFSPDAMLAALDGTRRVVIWGRNFWHTHYWVTVAYYRVLTRMRIPVVWCEDDPSNDEEIGPDDFVIYNHADAKHIPLRPQRGFLAFRKDLMPAAIVQWLEQFPGVYIWQQGVGSSGIRIDQCTWYDPEARVLAQPWGTDLLPSEFRDPVCASDSHSVFWIGSVWTAKTQDNIKDWGNKSEMQQLHEALQRHGVKIVQIEDGYTEANAAFVRASRLGLSVQGGGQIAAQHLACRFFKNTSYGTFAVSNNMAARDLLGTAAVYAADIGTLVDEAMLITPGHAAEMTRAAQDVVRDFTIGSHLYLAAVIARKQLMG